MKRRTFIQNTALTGGLSLLDPIEIISGNPVFRSKEFPLVRVAEGERNFQSKVIERAIKEFQKNVKDEELGWFFNNCFPNTLDTTVIYSEKNGKPGLPGRTHYLESSYGKPISKIQNY